MVWVQRSLDHRLGLAHMHYLCIIIAISSSLLNKHNCRALIIQFVVLHKLHPVVKPMAIQGPARVGF